mgnify:CR=1 FL=1
MSRWFVIGYRSNIILVRCKSIYNYVKDDILFGYNKDDKIKASKVIKDSRLRVFQAASTDADIRIDRRRHPHRPMQMLYGVL